MTTAGECPCGQAGSLPTQRQVGSPCLTKAHARPSGAGVQWTEEAMKQALPRPSTAFAPRQESGPTPILPAWWNTPLDDGRNVPIPAQYLPTQPATAGSTFASVPRVLIVDDEAEVRNLCR